MRSGKKHALCFTQHIPNQYVFQNICILSVKNVEEGNGMREKKITTRKINLYGKIQKLAQFSLGKKKS